MDYAVVSGYGYIIESKDLDQWSETYSRDMKFEDEFSWQNELFANTVNVGYMDQSYFGQGQTKAFIFIKDSSITIMDRRVAQIFDGPTFALEVDDPVESGGEDPKQHRKNLDDILAKSSSKAIHALGEWLKHKGKFSKWLVSEYS
jgi:hypothetical protein